MVDRQHCPSSWGSSMLSIMLHWSVEINDKSVVVHGFVAMSLLVS